MPISRQRRWQLRKISEGKCQICGKPAFRKGSPHCAEHHEKARILSCKRRGISPDHWRPGIQSRIPFGKEGEYKAWEDEMVEAALIMLNDGLNVREVSEELSLSPQWVRHRIKLVKIWVPVKKDKK
jgi:hypothetical protein